jgi:hypothetical protein
VVQEVYVFKHNCCYPATGLNKIDVRLLISALFTIENLIWAMFRYVSHGAAEMQSCMMIVHVCLLRARTVHYKMSWLVTTEHVSLSEMTMTFYFCLQILRPHVIRSTVDVTASTSEYTRFMKIYLF